MQDAWAGPGAFLASDSREFVESGPPTLQVSSLRNHRPDDFAETARREVASVSGWRERYPVVHALRGYLFAFAVTVATIALVRVVGAATDAHFGLEPFLIPIALSAFFGGLGPGIAAIVLSTLIAALGVSIDPTTPEGAVEWAGMLVGGGLFVFMLDHTRRARRSLASREERFAIIAAAAMDGILTLDEDLRVTSFNPAAEKMFGVPAAQMIGHGVERLLPEDVVGRHRQLMGGFGRSGPTSRVLGAGGGVLGRRANGELFPIELSISQAVVDGCKVYTGILRDLTERLRAERSLRETESQLRLFIESAPAAIAMLDRDMRYIFVSRRWLTDYGLTASKVIGRSHYEIFPEAEKVWGETHRRCLAGAIEKSDEDCFLRHDGTATWIAWEVRPWFDAEGTIGGLIIMSEDVSERRRAVNALRDSEERWRLLVEMLPDATIVDDDGRITYVNQRGLDLWRATSADQIVGKLSVDLVPREVAPDLTEITQRYSQHGDLVPNWESSILALDGTVVPVESIARVRIEDGRRVAQVVIRDITTRRAADARLRFQDSMLRETGRIARVGGWAFDVASGEESWTEEVARIYGCDPGTPMTMAARIALYAGESREQLAAALSAALSNGIAYDLELELVTPSGESKWIRSIARPEMENGRVARVRGALQDVTAQHEAAEQICSLNEELEARVQVRTAELEAANRELEAFSYTVSHDLRAPLRTMDGFAEMVEEDYAGLLPPDGARRLHVIRERAQRMGTLIDDLLAFSRLGREPLRPTMVDMRALVDETLTELLAACSERQIEIDVGELPPCRGDRALLKQVWVNLLSNALKYTRPRETAHVSVGCTGDEYGDAVYFVRDDGTGFDMAHAGTLFGVFQRLHRNDEFEGTGVGLAIVQRIVQRHGGRVWCDSRPDAGATFAFTVATDEGRVA
jgi:PAS domain S-box-containing protein